MSSNKNDKCFPIVCFSVIGFGLFISFLFSLISISNYYDHEEASCKITHLYPEQNITIDLNYITNNSDNWVDCDCGRRCRSTTYCTKIIGTL